MKRRRRTNQQQSRKFGSQREHSRGAVEWVAHLVHGVARLVDRLSNRCVLRKPVLWLAGLDDFAEPSCCSLVGHRHNDNGGHSHQHPERPSHPAGRTALESDKQTWQTATRIHNTQGGTILVRAELLTAHGRKVSLQCCMLYSPPLQWPSSRGSPEGYLVCVCHRGAPWERLRFWIF